MKLLIEANFCVDKIDRKVVESGCLNDCLKILTIEAFKKVGYNCEISKLIVHSVQNN